MLLYCCCQPSSSSHVCTPLLLHSANSACWLGDGQILSPNYALLPVDLRDLDALQSSLQSAGFQPNVPTFVLAECVLVYMQPHESAALVKHLGQQLSSAVCVVYEQVAHLCSDVLSLQQNCSIWPRPAHQCLLQSWHAWHALNQHKQ